MLKCQILITEPHIRLQGRQNITDIEGVDKKVRIKVLFPTGYQQHAAAMVVLRNSNSQIKHFLARELGGGGGDGGGGAGTPVPCSSGLALFCA